jgi:hypothetical protein
VKRANARGFAMSFIPIAKPFMIKTQAQVSGFRFLLKPDA